MIRVGSLPTQIQRGVRYRNYVWASLAIAAYLLAYSLSRTNAGTDFGDWPASWELPIQEPIDIFFDWIADTFSWFFNPISDAIDVVLSSIDSFLLWLPWSRDCRRNRVRGIQTGW